MPSAQRHLIRPIEPADLDAIVALNNAYPAELGLVDAASLRGFLAAAAAANAIGPASDPDAFLVAFDQGTPPQGPNHAWFLARRERFFYVDRICVHPRAQRRGLARELYLDAFRIAAERGLPSVCCEVSIDPPNPTSDAFHASLGFVEVGRAHLPERGKWVHYLERIESDSLPK